MQQPLTSARTLNPEGGEHAISAAGISTVLSSVREWAEDPGRFDPEWVQAVQAVIEQARAALITTAGSASVR